MCRIQFHKILLGLLFNLVSQKRACIPLPKSKSLLVQEEKDGRPQKPEIDPAQSQNREEGSYVVNLCIFFFSHISSKNLALRPKGPTVSWLIDSPDLG